MLIRRRRVLRRVLLVVSGVSRVRPARRAHGAHRAHPRGGALTLRVPAARAPAASPHGGVFHVDGFLRREIGGV